MIDKIPLRRMALGAVVAALLTLGIAMLLPRDTRAQDSGTTLTVNAVICLSENSCEPSEDFQIAIGQTDGYENTDADGQVSQVIGATVPGTVSVKIYPPEVAGSTGYTTQVACSSSSGPLTTGKVDSGFSGDIFFVEAVDASDVTCDYSFFPELASSAETPVDEDIQSEPGELADVTLPNTGSVSRSPMDGKSNGILAVGALIALFGGMWVRLRRSR